MTRYQDQGEGELVPGRGIQIVEILAERRGKATLIELRSGEEIVATNVSCGRDIGEEWEHIFFSEGAQSYFLSTAEINGLLEPDNRAVLYSVRNAE